MTHAEREWDFGQLAEFVPQNDGYDTLRAFGCYEGIEHASRNGDEDHDE